MQRYLLFDKPWLILRSDVSVDRIHFLQICKKKGIHQASTAGAAGAIASRSLAKSANL